MTGRTNDQLPRIAASSYLNTAPLIWSFISGSQRESVELITDAAPARCADLLSSGTAEVALVPVIEYQRLPEVLIVPDVCVGSRSAVRSVVIVSQVNNLKKIKRVALDNSSRTSVALVKIIFREFLGIEAEWETSPPELKSMLVQADAALIIGDPAMKIGGDHLHVFDLATLWRDYTGFGFVFAMWMMRPEAAVATQTIDFASARNEGLAHLDEIVAQYSTQLDLSADEIKTYLTKNIAFQMDEDMKRGLQRYFELAHKHGLIDDLKEIKFARG